MAIVPCARRPWETRSSGPRSPLRRGRSSSGQLHPLVTRTGGLGPPLCPSCRWTRACLDEQLHGVGVTDQGDAGGLLVLSRRWSPPWPAGSRHGPEFGGAIPATGIQAALPGDATAASPLGRRRRQRTSSHVGGGYEESAAGRSEMGWRGEFFVQIGRAHV